MFQVQEVKKTNSRTCKNHHEFFKDVFLINFSGLKKPLKTKFGTSGKHV